MLLATPTLTQRFSYTQPSWNATIFLAKDLVRLVGDHVVIFIPRSFSAALKRYLRDRWACSINRRVCLIVSPQRRRRDGMWYVMGEGTNDG